MIDLRRTIEEAAKNSSTELHLSRKEIKKLPSEISLLTNLRVLHLRSNSLEELPPEIGKLSSLEEIYIQNNSLKFLPSEFCSLERLRILELYGNELKDLPEEFANLTNLTTLLLSANRFMSFPSVLWELPSLEKLDLRSNRIEDIPEYAHEPLTRLKDLSLSINGLKALPSVIGRLKHLVSLDLYNNKLITLPVEVGRLKGLTYLSLDGNQLQFLPPEIGGLQNLQTLSAAGNKLKTLPRELGLLKSLERLNLYQNELTSLPGEIGNLERLNYLELQYNKLTSPPPEVVQQGVKAIQAYLRAELKDSKQQWVSKLILVGEGGVGKTSVLRALLSEPFDTQESSTRGIAIRPVMLRHPEISEVQMLLNAWDFGGQEIYHATHQFFLTNRSVFIVVWNARLGFEQSKLYYWLDMIQALAPDSPVLIVATHLDQRDGDLPLEDLRNKYRQIQGYWPVSNSNGQGIAELRASIATAAASLPLMGEIWPGAWLRAAEAIRQHPDNSFTPKEMYTQMASCGVTGADRTILATWLHELGDILFYQDDEELRDVVILKPEWVTRSISKVLESERLIRELGIFTREDMTDIWSDIEPSMRDHFLRLMERFDLSYRTLENREISIVVERLRHDPPSGYKEAWNGIQSSPETKEIAMTFRFGSTLPAGMPTWFIARSHRFTTHTHWRHGAVFADRSDRKHLALVEANRHERNIRLTVRGPQPQNFFALLREGLEVTIRRFPGIRVTRTIPCPCSEQAAGPCSHEFNLEYLERATAQSVPILEVQCQRSFKTVSVMGLLFGIHWRVQDAVLKEIEAMRGDVGELIELVQREFLSAFRRDQAVVDSHCPNVFTILPTGNLQTLVGSHGRTLKDDWLVREVELQLYCQAPGHWHATVDGGKYKIRNFSKWVEAIAPYVGHLLSILKYSAKAKSGLSIDIKFKDYLSFMGRLASQAEALPTSSDLSLLPPEPARGADLRALHQLLDALDPDHRWGNLAKILTPEGHYLWLCAEHAEEYLH